MSLPSAQRSSFDRASGRAQSELDARMRLLYGKARLLMGATSRRDMADRARLVRALERDEPIHPRWQWRSVRVESRFWKLLEEARELADCSEASAMYLRRLESLEVELSLLEVLGQPRAVRPMSARLYGTGQEVPDGQARPIIDIARDLLTETQPEPDHYTLPAAGMDQRSVESTVRSTARTAGMEIDVKVEPSLAASAAVGERTVFLADRLYSEREAIRFSVHEVLGHLVSQFNGRAQRLAIFELGTAGAFADQEGVAIYLEECAGVMCGSRLRTLAARVLVTHAVHQGAHFAEIARALVRDHGLSAEESIVLCERAYRGGGIARDAVYLRCWLNVRHAIQHGHATLAELQRGKVSLQDLDEIRPLVARGTVREGVYCPNFALSLVSTGVGTNSDTSPPSLATSLTRLDAT